MSEVTQVLKAIDQGVPEATDRLLPLVDQELSRLFLGMDSPESYLFLAMAHCKAGDEVEAERWFQIAVLWRAEHAHNFEQRRLYEEATELRYY